LESCHHGFPLEFERAYSCLLYTSPSSVVVTMEDLADTDVEQFLVPTLLRVEPVHDSRIRTISTVLDELIRDTREQIDVDLDEDGNLDLIGDDPRRVHLMLERLPVSDRLKSQYLRLLLLRKYVFAMPPSQFLPLFQNEYLAHYLNVSHMRHMLPEVSTKAQRVLEIASQYKKTVVLTSYLEMVSQIRRLLTDAGLQTLTITGQTRDKNSVLQRFRDEDVRVLIMSPVGERDLDIPQADVMIVCDTVNTVKTMYQKFKRTRGGEVILLVYAGTSEERKVKRLIDNLLERYPWSTEMSG